MSRSIIYVATIKTTIIIRMVLKSIIINIIRNNTATNTTTPTVSSLYLLHSTSNAIKSMHTLRSGSAY